MKTTMDDYDINLSKKERDLVEYNPSPVRKAMIPKKEPGKKRAIFILKEPDKQYQRKTLLPELNERINPHLAYNTFAYRKGVSIVDVVSFLEQLISKGYNLVYKVDISKYYDNINREILYGQLEPLVSEQCLDDIKRSIEVPYEYNGSLTYLDKGIYQGIPISSTLSNLYLTDMDNLFQGENEVYSPRYSDDILLVAKSKEKLKKAITELKTELRKKGLWCKWKEARRSNLEKKETTYLGLRISKGNKGLSVRASYHAERDLRRKILEADSEEKIKDCIRSRLFHYTVGGRYPNYQFKAKRIVEETLGGDAWDRLFKDDWITKPYGEWNDIRD
ncbi:reverse transcriptase domain-containing protein [Gudongella sp. DL1XJH-153]|uniref:reverse transcriptase domain-containing protein n=1 Tax=Gudongella sp. DL1XJH-153 TaxID=3409804 RepID=UPI003BB71DFE